MKIIVRPATKLPQIIIHRKVAAYCRVSTQQEIQHHSLEAQRISSPQGDFIIKDDFTHPTGWINCVPSVAKMIDRQTAGYFFC